MLSVQCAATQNTACAVTASYGVFLCHDCFMKNPSRWVLPHPSDRTSPYKGMDTTTFDGVARDHARAMVKSANVELEVPHGPNNGE